ncbi:hypothetical protein [Nocardia altamirensis]|nr:hypothetical protein [Nocardia altamirensis]
MNAQVFLDEHCNALLGAALQANVRIDDRFVHPPMITGGTRFG